MRQKQRIYLVILASLIALVVFACYTAKRKSYFYLFGSICSQWYNAKLAKITEEGYSMCPPETEGLCKTPCWNGIPYQEPEFLLMPNCTQYSSRQALVYVYSSLDNHQLRQSIRQEFREALFQNDDMTVSLVFVVGSPNNVSHNGGTVMVENEHKTYGDIIQISIQDFYTNLAFKGLAVFKWVQLCGEKTKYLVKLDDNALNSTDMNMIFWRLKAMQGQDQIIQNSVVCLYTLYDHHVYEPKIKPHWVNNFKQYYSAKFPPFCMGKDATFLTRQVALSLYKAARGGPVYHIDDVYITGMLRERACIQLLDWGPISVLLRSIYRKTLDLFVEMLSFELVLEDLHRLDTVLS